MPEKKSAALNTSRAAPRTSGTRSSARRAAERRLRTRTAMSRDSLRTAHADAQPKSNRTPSATGPHADQTSFLLSLSIQSVPRGDAAPV